MIEDRKLSVKTYPKLKWLIRFLVEYYLIRRRTPTLTRTVISAMPQNVLQSYYEM